MPTANPSSTSPWTLAASDEERNRFPPHLRPSLHLALLEEAAEGPTFPGYIGGWFEGAMVLVERGFLTYGQAHGSVVITEAGRAHLAGLRGGK